MSENFRGGDFFDAHCTSRKYDQRLDPTEGASLPPQYHQTEVMIYHQEQI